MNKEKFKRMRPGDWFDCTLPYCQSKWHMRHTAVGRLHADRLYRTRGIVV